MILGILAATAVPKFIDLSGEAQNASAASMAGAMESASALNHAVDIANEANLSSDTFEIIDDCADADTLLEGGLPTGYSLTGGGVGDKATATCTLVGPGDSDPTFTLIGACPGIVACP